MFPDLATSFLKERNAGSLVPEELLIKSEANDASNRYAPSEFNITLHGETYHINLTGSGNSGDTERPFYVSVDGISEEVLVETLDQVVVSDGNAKNPDDGDNTKQEKTSKHARPTHDGCVTTAMPGTIIDIKVKVGDSVNAGDSVIVIEAMKMENEIQASKSGIVVAIHVANGDSVSPNETLIEIQPQ
jgi:pyruvate carboxylase subunit B